MLSMTLEVRTYFGSAAGIRTPIMWVTTTGPAVERQRNRNNKIERDVFYAAITPITSHEVMLESNQLLLFHRQCNPNRAFVSWFSLAELDRPTFNLIVVDALAMS